MSTFQRFGMVAFHWSTTFLNVDSSPLRPPHIHLTLYTWYVSVPRPSPYSALILYWTQTEHKKWGYPTPRFVPFISLWLWVMSKLVIKGLVLPLIFFWLFSNPNPNPTPHCWQTWTCSESHPCMGRHSSCPDRQWTVTNPVAVHVLCAMT